MIVVVVMMMREERIKSTISFTMGVHTGDLDQGCDITEKVVQSVFSTETQPKVKTCLYHGVDAATDVGGNHQTNTSLLGHMNRQRKGEQMAEKRSYAITARRKPSAPTKRAKKKNWVAQPL